MEKKNYIIGLWKFSDAKVSLEQLKELAEEWAKDENYVHLYVRGASTDQTAIGFAYKFDGDQKASHEFNDKMKDYLYKKFGTGLVGWDISSGDKNLAIKGF